MTSSMSNSKVSFVCFAKHGQYCEPFIRMADTLVPEHVEYGLEADVESIVAGTLVGVVLTVVIFLMAEAVDVTFVVA